MVTESKNGKLVQAFTRRVTVSVFIIRTATVQPYGVLTVRLYRVRRIMKRDMEALKHIANGESIDQAADKMCLSRSSVEKLLHRVRNSLNARTLAHAVHLATKQGFIMLLITVVLTTPTGRISPRSVRVTRREILSTSRI